MQTRSVNDCGPVNDYRHIFSLVSGVLTCCRCAAGRKELTVPATPSVTYVAGSRGQISKALSSLDALGPKGTLVSLGKEKMADKEEFPIVPRKVHG